jgi:hypothetical protein
MLHTQKVDLHKTHITGRRKYFQIKLENNPSGVYFGGDVVPGKIFIGLEGNGKKARGKEDKKDGESNVH